MRASTWTRSRHVVFPDRAPLGGHSSIPAKSLTGPISRGNQRAPEENVSAARRDSSGSAKHAAPQDISTQATRRCFRLIMRPQPRQSSGRPWSPSAINHSALWSYRSIFQSARAGRPVALAGATREYVSPDTHPRRAPNHEAPRHPRHRLAPCPWSPLQRDHCIDPARYHYCSSCQLHAATPWDWRQGNTYTLLTPAILSLSCHNRGHWRQGSQPPHRLYYPDYPIPTPDPPPELTVLHPLHLAASHKASSSHRHYLKQITSARKAFLSSLWRLLSR